MSIAYFAGARKALIASIALASLFGAQVHACDAIDTSGTDTSASTTTAVSATINPFTNTDWLNGIWRKSPGFSIPSSSANQAAFVKGVSVKFADGQVRKITAVYIVGSNMSVYTDGAVLDGNQVGYPKSVSIASSSTASTTTTTGTSSTTSGSTSTDSTTSSSGSTSTSGSTTTSSGTSSTTSGSTSTTTTAPSTSTTGSTTTSTATTSASATVNPFTNTDWLNGIWRKSPGFSIPNSSANQAAFIKGASVKFADGQVRKITAVYKVGANMSVYTDGAVLDGNRVGYPKSVAVVSATSSTTSTTTASTSTATTSPSTTTSTTTAPSTSTTTSTTTSSSTASTVVATSSINNFTNSDWLNGVWRKSPGFSLPATTTNKSAFKVGASVKMADGQVRKVQAVYLVGSNMSIYLDGAAVSGETVGYPKTLSAIN